MRKEDYSSGAELILGELVNWQIFRKHNLILFVLKGAAKMRFKESLLRSWLDFIDLEDKADAAIDVKNISKGIFADLNRSIELNGNLLRNSNRAVFERVKKNVKDKKIPI